ncbi:ATP-binding protein [Sciscionella marina]|uniref:ATP-binding protein n=1 Tax=Sciscionella marina TaxID=508770 RepID=UPI0023E344E9|nr:ATP-binding protein [Sciscionella marina]
MASCRFPRTPRGLLPASGCLLRALRACGQLKSSSVRIRRDHAETLATATVDRLLHHAHVVVTESDSYRLTEATTGKGVKLFT